MNKAEAASLAKAVFVPNRIIVARLSVWHLLPRAGIRGQARFEGTIEDERKRKPRSVDDDFTDDVRTRTRDAAAALRNRYAAGRPVGEEMQSLRLPGHVQFGSSRSMMRRRPRQ